MRYLAILILVNFILYLPTQEDRIPLASATVKLTTEKGEGVTAKTDTDGVFILESVPKGTYHVSVEAKGKTEFAYFFRMTDEKGKKYEYGSRLGTDASGRKHLVDLVVRKATETVEGQICDAIPNLKPTVRYLN